MLLRALFYINPTADSDKELPACNPATFPILQTCPASPAGSADDSAMTRRAKLACSGRRRPAGRALRWLNDGLDTQRNRSVTAGKSRADGASQIYCSVWRQFWIADQEVLSGDAASLSAAHYTFLRSRYQVPAAHTT
jgi:hypothetical protein